MSIERGVTDPNDKPLNSEEPVEEIEGLDDIDDELDEDDLEDEDEDEDDAGLGDAPGEPSGDA